MGAGKPIDLFFHGVIAGTIALLALSLALFAATLWLHRRNDRRATRWRDLEARWEEALLAVLAGDADPESVWSRVAQGSELYFLQYLRTYHRTLAGEERARVEALAAPYLPLLAPRLRDRLPEIRARAVLTLGTLGPAAHGPALRAALDDPSDLVAMQAAGVLARTGDIRHLPAILSHFHRYRAWSSGFLVSLLASPGPAAAPALREVFSDPARDRAERAFAGLALLDLADPGSAGPAAAACAAESDPLLLEAALALLGRVGGPEHLPAIRPHRLSPDPGVRRQALRALGALGGEDVWDELRASLEDESAAVRAQAGRSLVSAGAEESLRELARARGRRGDLARQSLEGAP